MKVVHDIHTHNVFSKCCVDRTASTEAYMRKEAELGMRVFGLSNHIWDESVRGASQWYASQTISVGEEAKNAFSKAPSGLRVLFGAETEYYGCRDLLGMSAEGATHFDYLLIPHSHLHMRNEVMAEYPEIRELRNTFAARLTEQFPMLNRGQVKRMVAVLKENDLSALVPEWKTDIREYQTRVMVDNFCGLLHNTEFCKIVGRIPVVIAHPFSPCGVSNTEKNSFLRYLTDQVLDECFSKAAAMGVFIEINTGAVSEVNRDLTDNQMIRILSIAKKAGCRFTFGTDSHSVRGLELSAFSTDIANALGLTKSDFADFIADGVLD